MGQISPFAEAPTSLGAGRWTNDRVAASPSHYWQLERPTILPSPSWVTIHHHDDKEYFILEARLDENTDYTICLVLHTYNTEMGKSTMSLNSFYAKHTMFIDLCTTKQEHRIRILHQFIRLGGYG